MSRIISSSKDVEEQVNYLTRWTIQPLFAGKLCSPEIVRVLSLKIVSIEMKFLPSRVPSTMKVANLFTKDSLPTFIDLLNALQ